MSKTIEEMRAAAKARAAEINERLDAMTFEQLIEVPTRDLPRALLRRSKQHGRTPDMQTFSLCALCAVQILVRDLETLLHSGPGTWDAIAPELTRIGAAKTRETLEAMREAGAGSERWAQLEPIASELVNEELKPRVAQFARAHLDHSDV